MILKLFLKYFYDDWEVNWCSTSLPGGNQVDGLPPAPSTGAVSASWPPGRKRTQTWFLMTFFEFSQKFENRFANPIFVQEKYERRTCHLKDFEIHRQDSEKRWREGRSSEVKIYFWWRFLNFLKSYIFVWQIRFFSKEKYVRRTC